MRELGSLEQANEKVFGDSEKCLSDILSILSEPRTTSESKVVTLGKLRRSVYESLNQIPHEFLIIRATEWLFANCPSSKQWKWYWNPNQTGTADEPDLRGMRDDAIVLSAEITASESPIGSIRSRMHKTIEKLSKMQGDLFYFVRTASMENAAKRKIAESGWKIRVICIPDPE